MTLPFDRTHPLADPKQYLLLVMKWTVNGTIGGGKSHSKVIVEECCFFVYYVWKGTPNICIRVTCCRCLVDRLRTISFSFLCKWVPLVIGDLTYNWYVPKYVEAVCTRFNRLLNGWQYVQWYSDGDLRFSKWYF